MGHFLGLIGCFCIFLVILWGYGRLVTRLLPGLATLPYQILWEGVLGLWLVSFLTFIACSFGFLNSSVFVGLATLGILGSWRGKSFFSKEIKPKPFWPLLIFLTIGVFGFFEASLPDGHPDPLYYHILGPRIWAQNDAMVFDPERPLLFQCSNWEMLYVWPSIFFKVAGVHGFSGNSLGLVEMQIFCQWVHFFLGYGLSCFAIFALLRALAFSTSVASMGAIASGFAYSLWWTVSLAKNDLGACVYLISALALFLLARSERKLSFGICLLSGILLGTSFTAKYTTLFMVIPVCFAFFFLTRDEEHRSRRYSWMFAIVLGALLGASGILLRNSLGTGDPIFPTGSSRKNPEMLGPTYRLNYIGSFADSHISLGNFFFRIPQLLKEHILIWGWILLPLSYREISRTARFERVAIITCVFLSFILFTLLSGPRTQIRLWGPGLVLCLALAVPVAIEALKRIRIQERWALCLVLLLALAGSQFPLHSPKTFLQQWPLVDALRPHFGSGAKAWLRAHMNPGERATTTGEDGIFYVSAFDVTTIPLNTVLDSEMYQIKTIESGFDILRRHNIRYLIDVRFPNGSSWPGLGRLIAKNSDKLAALVVYKDETSLILDLNRGVRF